MADVSERRLPPACQAFPSGGSYPTGSPHKFAFFKPSEEEIATTLARGKVDGVRGDGKYIYVDLEPRALFSIAEMDGRILSHEKGAELPAKYQLLVRFADGTALTATVGRWGFWK